MTWTVEDILKATGGELVTGVRDRSFDSISIDSRTITNREAFVAIQGEVHDGHRFLGDVLKQGIGGVLISRRRVGDALALMPCRRGLIAMERLMGMLLIAVAVQMLLEGIAASL